MRATGAGLLDGKRRMDMKEIMVKMYQCDHCKFKSEFKYQVEDHEKTCLESQAWNEYYQRKLKARMKEIETNCVIWAREDKLLNIMVENEIDLKQIMDRIRNVYHDHVCDDVGWDGWRKDMYVKMYNALFVNENGEYEDD